MILPAVIIAAATALPDAPGRQFVLDNCTSCHSEALILQNRMDRDSWDRAITWMQQTQGLWPIPPDIRATILDYLGTSLGPAEAFDAAGIRRRANPLPPSPPASP